MIVHRTKIDDWNEWHEEYDAPGSELAGRLDAVRSHVRRIVTEAPPGPVTVVSICGGEGREVIGALEHHARVSDVGGRLIELDPENAATAARSAAAVGLDGFEVVNGDASTSDAYGGLPPVDVVVISGLFGHIDDDDQVRLIAFLRQICRPGAAVVWTFTARKPERVPKLRRFWIDQGFEEVDFASIPGDQLALTVALSTLNRSTDEFRPGVTLFTFGSSHRSLGRTASPESSDEQV